eukprot:2198313-Pyramimonas_sp.AAC.1
MPPGKICGRPKHDGSSVFGGCISRTTTRFASFQRSCAMAATDDGRRRGDGDKARMQERAVTSTGGDPGAFEANDAA